jgi:hypothetical protein
MRRVLFGILAVTLGLATLGCEVKVEDKSPPAPVVDDTTPDIKVETPNVDVKVDK